MGKDIPLHKRTHFRRTREIMTEIGKYEGFNMNDYDLFNIRAYETVGENLKGKNVSYNIQGGYSCWVKDNKYEMFEVPSKSNRKGSPYGEFLFLAYNKSFQYYLFGYMTVNLDSNETRRTKHIVEDVYFKNHGKFDITFSNNDNHIHKVEYGSKFDPGVQSDEHNFEFDSYNSRKISYGTNKYKILNSLGISTIDPSKMVGKNAVEVYKKKKPNTNKPRTSSNRPGSTSPKKYGSGKPNSGQKKNKYYH